MKIKPIPALTRLLMMIFPIYARHLTFEEPDSLIEFNKSVVGRKPTT